MSHHMILGRMTKAIIWNFRYPVQYLNCGGSKVLLLGFSDWARMNLVVLYNGPCRVVCFSPCVAKASRVHYRYLILPFCPLPSVRQHASLHAFPFTVFPFSFRIPNLASSSEPRRRGCTVDGITLLPYEYAYGMSCKKGFNYWLLDRWTWTIEYYYCTSTWNIRENPFG